MCDATKRFGDKSLPEIRENIKITIPISTIKTQTSTWNQFMHFCAEKNYELTPLTTIAQLATILEDYGFNMKRKDGTDYKEKCIKSIWNTTAKMLQTKYFNEYNISFDPFNDIEFKRAREARNSKRKLLREHPDKTQRNSRGLSRQEIQAMASVWDEENPDGLQRKVFHILSYELEWREVEAANCKLDYFKEESGTKLIEYRPDNNPDSKWLTQNIDSTSLCPVRLYRKLVEKRGNTIKTNRLFLTVNPNWQNGAWFKNMPLGVNYLSKWTKTSAEKAGISTKKIKISSVRSLTNEEQHEQEETHQFRQVLCPIAPLDTCDWIGSFYEIREHFEEEHASYIFESPCSFPRLELIQSNYQNYLITAHRFLFLLQVKVCLTSGSLYHCVRLLGDNKYLDKFSFDLEVRGNASKVVKSGAVLRAGIMELQEPTAICTKVYSLLDILGVEYDQTDFRVIINSSVTFTCINCFKDIHFDSKFCNECQGKLVQCVFSTNGSAMNLIP